MNKLRYLKYGAGLATSGFLATTFTNSIIITESEGDDKDSESVFERTFKSFKGSFKWSKVSDKIPIDGPTRDKSDMIIDSIPLRDKYQAPKYPIVLCHGLSGFDRLVLVPSLNQLTNFLSGKTFIKNIEEGQEKAEVVLEDKGGISLAYWYGIQDALEAKGTTVFVAKVPGFGSIQERADELNKFITNSVNRLRNQSKDEVYNDPEESRSSFKQKEEKMKINLIAHSMGGLDCRWLISEMEKQNYEVVSLTTITTPHRGSQVADYVVDVAKNLSEDLKLPPSIYQLTSEYLVKFNETVKDDPNVLYFSYGASFSPKWYNVFFGTWNIINSIDGANDGMVSVKSAKWGTYLGTLSDLDHLDLINWTNSLKRSAKEIAPNGAVSTGGINTIALYLEVADNLAKRGL